jgi:hypothetical protein
MQNKSYPFFARLPLLPVGPYLRQALDLVTRRQLFFHNQRIYLANTALIIALSAANFPEISTPI